MRNAEIFWNETGWRDIPLHWYLMFMRLSSYPTSMSQLVKFAPKASAHASVTRCISALCGVSKLRKDGGVAVAEMWEDPSDRRCKLVKLNAEGIRIRSLMS